jgi:hypothetical protein
MALVKTVKKVIKERVDLPPLAADVQDHIQATARNARMRASRSHPLLALVELGRTRLQLGADGVPLRQGAAQCRLARGGLRPIQFRRWIATSLPSSK